MKKVTYLAVFEPTSSGYSVYFPDLPGCISYGEDIAKASVMAQEALSLHYYGMKTDNENIPAPSLSLSREDTEGNIVCPITITPAISKMEITASDG